MIKKLESLALVALATFFLGSTAQAGPQIDLIWRTNGTDTIKTLADGGMDAPDMCASCGSAGYVLEVVLSNDGVNLVGGVFLSFLFDTDGMNELNFIAGPNELAVAKIGMNNSFSPIIVGVTLATESSAGVTGVINNFDTATLATGLGTGTLTIGSLIFSANTGKTDGVDVIPAILTAFDGITEGGGSGADIAGLTSFNGAHIIPEPTTALLVVFGLGGLAFAGRRSLD